MADYHTKMLIIGSGPAGYTAAIYAARGNLSPVLVTGMQPGGQLTITTDVENYPGFADVIQGPWLMEQMRAQAEHVGTKILFDTINDIDTSQRPFVCLGENGDRYIAETIVISTGAQAKWLGLSSEESFRGYGVSGCATCDAFFFKNQEVVVVGGGNTAVEDALFLTQHASKITLVHRRDSLRAEKILQDRLLNNEKVRVIWNHTVVEILGEATPKTVTGIRLKDIHSGAIQDLEAQGVFIAIGHKPATEIFRNKLDLDEHGYIKCRPNSTWTSVPGIFAAGDVQDSIYRQAVTAAGQGCMAALDAQRFLSEV
ncbi:MAG: thioredoxin-disulfide reductase [Candidatus Paracaedimonas acanthamoebae]|uniref:Thioredoxin reductase n=1 Tax=Candidatus Paracaedimonas acanthamoebae TaxID=244581 RepID=A0A8J7TUV6_9PROT|nr:thioredoxin-disulfide reductase [Candidatus Paracaedimonas acanthamoebae]